MEAAIGPGSNEDTLGVSGTDAGVGGGGGIDGSGSGSCADESNSGRSLMGTASRYGRISGSMGCVYWERFFQRSGVWLGCDAKREHGNGCGV